jgi:hypothetical protein
MGELGKWGILAGPAPLSVSPGLRSRPGKGKIMPQREFEITIAPDGSVELLVKGYKGKSCLEAMKIFEQIVGELKSQGTTSEYFEPDENVRINLDQRH